MRCLVAIALTFVVGRASIGWEPAQPPTTRAEFAKAISKLKESMYREEALRLLGPPDDMRTERDPGGLYAADTKQTRRYGTGGHLTTATLGQVYIAVKDRVQYHTNAVRCVGSNRATTKFE